MKHLDTNKLFDITVGVITYARRFESINEFLGLLISSIDYYQETTHNNVELLLVNNSGADYESELNAYIFDILKDIKFESTRISSSKNNISTGRNIVLTKSKHRFIAFIDDDEIPQKTWLTELAEAMYQYKSAAVTAPVYPEFPVDTPKWITNIDLHNTYEKEEGERIKHTATCNVILDKNKIGNTLFDEKYGRTGGSDTQYFLKLTDNSEEIVWTNKAPLIEIIPNNRANFKYLLKRGISQGRNYRRIMTERNEISNSAIFTCRAFLVLIISSVVAAVCLLFRSPKASFWLKRAFTNLGFIKKPNDNLYD